MQSSLRSEQPLVLPIRGGRQKTIRGGRQKRFGNAASDSCRDKGVISSK